MGRYDGQDRREHQAIRLAGGRLLGLAEYGDPGGPAVFVFHREVGSRLLARAFDAPARELGVRVVSPDRPGMGFSDVQPGRSIAAWPADVAELAERLAVDRFAVLGVGAGAAYALACACPASGLAERLSRVVLVGPTLPAWMRELPPGTPPIRRLLRRSAMAPATIRAAMTLLGQASRRRPGQAVGRMAASAGEADRAALERPEIRALLGQSLAETFRSGARGPALDLRLATADWGLALGEIRLEAHLWRGAADAELPAAEARRLAGTVPRCTVLEVPGAGHHLDLSHPELPLAGAARG